jgi:tetratricopeptide (TPR) repeat protein
VDVWYRPCLLNTADLRPSSTGATLANGVPVKTLTKTTSLTLATILCLLVHAVPAVAQGDVRKLFEAGQYQPVIDAAGPEAQAPTIYLAALSHQKAGALEPAVATARRLAALPEDGPWHFIGQSLVALLEAQVDAAAASAQRAVDMPGAPAEAHYQLGLVFARQQQWREAAEAFDRAIEADPLFAYAHYYAGLMHNRAKRTDLMAVRFDRFLKLAPDAPERPEVTQIMRTVRGR